MDVDAMIGFLVSGLVFMVRSAWLEKLLVNAMVVFDDAGARKV